MRLSKANINLTNLNHNLSIIKNRAKESKIIPVVKANAYGHGIIEISKHLREEGFGTLAVAYPDEAVELRKNGDYGNILCMIPINLSDFRDVIEHDFEVAVDNLELLKLLNDAANIESQIINCHLYLNTGMNRSGVKYDVALDIVRNIKNLKYINLVGVMSHFANSEDEERKFALEQLSEFNKFKARIEEMGEELPNRIKNFHFCNSNAIFRLPEAHFSSVRAGLSMYGLLDKKVNSDKYDLKPVLSIRTRLITVNRIKEGETAGYSFKFVAEKDCNIGMIPMGYGDGFPTSLSNKMECLINGKRYKIVGSICMDLMLIDLGDDDIPINSFVTIIGKQKDEEITVYELAEKSGLLSYEISTMLTDRLPKNYDYL